MKSVFLQVDLFEKHIWYQKIEKCWFNHIITNENNITDNPNCPKAPDPTHIILIIGRSRLGNKELH